MNFLHIGAKWIAEQFKITFLCFQVSKVLHLNECAQILSIMRDDYHRVGDLSYHCLQLGK